MWTWLLSKAVALAEMAGLKIWNSLGTEKLVHGLSGVRSVKINVSSLVRLKCPNQECGKISDFSVERLRGNPKCLLCQETFDGSPFLQSLNEQLLAAVQQIGHEAHKGSP
jgi:hypothetical protein